MSRSALLWQRNEKICIAKEKRRKERICQATELRYCALLRLCKDTQRQSLASICYEIIQLHNLDRAGVDNIRYQVP